MSGAVQAFAMVPQRACFDKNLSHANRTLLCILAAYRNSRTGWCWPSFKTLASDMGYEGPNAERQIRRMLNDLRDAGYIELRLIKEAGKLKVGIPLDLPEPTEDQMLAEDVGNLPHDDGAICPQPMGQFAHIREQKKENRRNEQSTFASLTRAKAENELKLEPPKQTKQPALDEFSQFWKAYPNKTDKDDARRAFAKARKGTPFVLIMTGLESYNFKPFPTYSPPMAATWLNKRRWLPPESQLVTPQDDNAEALEMWEKARDKPREEKERMLMVFKEFAPVAYRTITERERAETRSRADHQEQMRP